MKPFRLLRSLVLTRLLLGGRGGVGRFNSLNIVILLNFFLVCFLFWEKTKRGRSQQKKPRRPGRPGKASSPAPAAAQQDDRNMRAVGRHPPLHPPRIWWRAVGATVERTLTLKINPSIHPSIKLMDGWIREPLKTSAQRLLGPAQLLRSSMEPREGSTGVEFRWCRCC